MEIKSPTGNGVISAEQYKFMERLKQAGFKTLLSNDYDFLVMEVVEYFREVETICTQCGKLNQNKNKHLQE
jgi:hypothetical protein